MHYPIIIIYAAVISASLLGMMAQSQSIGDKGVVVTSVKKESFSFPLFFLSFLILFLTVFFTKSGTDISVYVDFYNNWTWGDLNDFQIEPANKVLYLVIRSVIPNPYIGLGVVKFLNLLLVYYSIYLLKDKINVGVAIFAYGALLYVYSFHLLRMMTALGLMFVAFSFELCNKRWRCLICLALSVCFHYSAIVGIIGYGFYLFFKLIRTNSWKVFVLIIVSVTWALFGTYIIIFLVKTIPVLNKYESYIQQGAHQGSGIMQYVWFIPVAYLLFRTYPKTKSIFYELACVLGVMTFLVGQLGYSFAVIGRAVYYCYYFFVFYLGYIDKNKEVISREKFVSYYPFTLTHIMVLYLVIKVLFDIVIGDMFVSNGLTEYLLIWD